MSSLRLSEGELSPGFNTGILYYTTSVAFIIDSIEIYMKKIDDNATITINRIANPYFYWSGPVSLAVGENVITIVITASDKISKRIYTLTITREEYDPVYHGDYIINFQSDIDFISDRTTIDGGLHIHTILQITPDGLTSLPTITSLSNLTTITGYLIIENTTSLENLDGLSNLTTVNGNLIISKNEDLINLNGLSNLSSIGGYINIFDNETLSSIEGLNGLQSFNGNIIIYYNPNLQNINVLNNITLYNNIDIQGNSSLLTIGFPALESVTNNLRICDNDSLIDMDFPELRIIGGDFDVTFNNSLPSSIPEEIADNVEIWGETFILLNLD